MRINFLFAAMCLVLPGAPVCAAPPAELAKIRHVIVIYEENRSFDNLYGAFPGANGLANAGTAAVQVDVNGKPFAKLPPVCLKAPAHPGTDPATGAQACGTADQRFPPDLANAPFDAGQYVPLDQMTGDLVHRFYQEQIQIDGGRMDKFAAISDAGGLTMGHFDGSKLELWKIAQDYTVADNFFHAAFGGSFLNHMWLACACTPVFPSAPAAMVAQLGKDGALVQDGTVTPDGYAVNTIFATASPHPASAKPETLLPPQTLPTVGDRLSDAKISWAWYGAGYADAMAGHPSPMFQFHHQPYIYFARYADGKPDRTEHLKDGADFELAIKKGTLPAVSFYKPIGDFNEHPGYATLLAGDRKAAELVRAIQANKKLWESSVIIITHDENGGTWDHVAPPRVDRWGPGTRIPAFVISPFAKRGYVDHTPYDTTSILKLIETRFGLAPLGTRDANAYDMTNALQF
jgi:acid phosphatase